MTESTFKTINLIKKNRKYFAATVGGYKCKVLIDAESESLSLGEHECEVEDLSVKSKYGTDLIFKIKAASSDEEEQGIVSLRHYTYNKLLVDKCRQLNGKYDPEENAWIFSPLVSDQIEELDFTYNSKLVPVELHFNDEQASLCKPVAFLGYTLARATGRDSGAVLGDQAMLINGDIRSGGSAKNWTTIIEAGSILRLDVPEELLKENGYATKLVNGLVHINL
ncbi:TPA: hypothetical protein KDY48_004316 [Vibrio parahaemolyticus]|nr:hypothetical protein [Vibrio parahaemolyticus]HBC3383592.1 hypothetical protein [Vibrio parahaemolyticus]HBC3445582.1 hypothetical protein [Vibrio parahaemolyticus]HBC3845400.1 hypothetical protein [Vibrio parahaemolyticus]HBH7861979.1 hypothetical protein [Vibrio parahaemolyticus]